MRGVLRWMALALLAAVSGMLWIAWPTVAQETGPQKAASLYGYPFPDAPDCDEAALGRCATDKWGHVQGRSTSWVAFRLHKLLGDGARIPTRAWGEARRWGVHARSAGLTVDERPALGAIAWDRDGRAGHVAFVEQVLSPSAIVVSELDFDGHNGFRTRTVTPDDAGWPTGFIHVAPLDEHGPDAPEPGDGTLI